MAICSLCNKREAIKSNSHILPFFLIKTAISKEGSKQRDYELTFTFSEADLVETYFGRNITLDTIEKYKGRELTEEELVEKNPFSRDNLFCSECEVYFSQLEDYFSKKVHQPLTRSSFPNTFNDQKDNRVSRFTETVDSRLVFLFVYSIFFRCSVSKFQGFRLSGLERKFRKILNKYHGASEGEIVNKLKHEPDRFSFFSLITTFYDLPEGADATKNFVMVFHSDKPYFIHLNEMSFQLFPKEKHIEKTREYLFGLHDMLSRREDVCFGSDSFKVTILNEAQHGKILSAAFAFMAKRQMDYFKGVFIEMHQKIFGFRPTVAVVDYFLQILQSQDLPKGTRYGIEGLTQAMFKACVTSYNMR